MTWAVGVGLVVASLGSLEVGRLAGMQVLLLGLLGFAVAAAVNACLGSRAAEPGMRLSAACLVAGCVIGLTIAHWAGFQRVPGVIFRSMSDPFVLAGLLLGIRAIAIWGSRGVALPRARTRG